jgi:hypothetical protein
MFRKWLENNNVNDFNFDQPLFPKASDREFWQSKYNESYIKKAEEYLDFSWPVARATDFMAFKITGNRTKQETPFFERRKALIYLAYAELLEYKGRFLPDILNGIFAICEETFWGVSAHFSHSYTPDHPNVNIPDSQNDYIDLFVAETGSAISIVYYLFYDEFKKFCPEILYYMEYELNRRIINPYMNHKDFWWMGYEQDVNNWNGWIIANVLTVFLLAERDEEKKKQAVRRMIYEINKLYERLPDDGGCDEGSTYWTVSGGMIFEFVEQLYVATRGGIDFFKDEKLRNIFLYEYKAYIGNGRFVNYADGTGRAVGVSALLYMIGERTNHNKIKTLGKELLKYDKNAPIREGKARRLLYTIMYEDKLNECADFQYENKVFLSELQVSVLRNDKWYYAIKGGNNDEGHNHNDVGTFIAYYDNNAVLCDAGCGVYTRQTFGPERYTIWTMRSDWHNLPVINGAVQKQGLKFAASKFECSGNTTIVDIENAYAEKAGIQKLERRITLLDDGIDVEDKYEFVEDKNTVSEHFITPYNVKIDGNKVIINEEFVLECDKNVDIKTDFVDFEGDTKLVESWNTDKMKRIIFSTYASRNLCIKFNLRRI